MAAAQSLSLPPLFRQPYLMAIIDRYISREILTLFLLLLVLLIVIFIGFSSALQLKQAAAGKLSTSAVPQLILLNTLIALVILIPTTLFFACIAALGRLQRDYETLTMLSAGITPGHISFTVIKLAILVTLGTALLSIFLRPWAYERSYQLESEVLAKLDIRSFEPRQFIALPASGDVLYAQTVDLDTGKLGHVFLHRQIGKDGKIGTSSKANKVDQEPGAQLLITAATAELLPTDLTHAPALFFNDGQAYKLDPEGQQDMVLKFNNLTVPLPEDSKMQEYRRNAIDTRSLGLSSKPKDIAEYQWRLVTPLLTLLLAVIAVPLTTAKPWQSRSASIAAALVIYATVFGVTSAIRSAVEEGQIPPMPGLWLALLLPALLLLGLSLKARLQWGD